MRQARGHPRLTHRTDRGCAGAGLSDCRGETGKGRLCRCPGRQDGTPGHEPPCRPLRRARARPRAAAAAMARARGGVWQRSRGPAQPPFWSSASEGRNPRQDAAPGASASPVPPRAEPAPLAAFTGRRSVSAAAALHHPPGRARRRPERGGKDALHTPPLRETRGPCAPRLASPTPAAPRPFASSGAELPSLLSPLPWVPFLLD